MSRVNEEKKMMKTYQRLHMRHSLTIMHVRLESSSGGIFSELAATILQRGGVIYGASYDDEGESDILR